MKILNTMPPWPLKPPLFNQALSMNLEERSLREKYIERNSSQIANIHALNRNTNTSGIALDRNEIITNYNMTMINGNISNKHDILADYI